jgi:hypothetical protein
MIYGLVPFFFLYFGPLVYFSFVFIFGSFVLGMLGLVVVIVKGLGFRVGFPL